MKLSIITVCRNNLKGLQKTADSILCQTCRDFEWLVIDGDSHDGTKEYLSSLQPQPAYWCSEPDAGIYQAMNKGIKLAKGTYLLFLNSGDTLVDDTVLKQVIPLLKDDDIIYGDSNFCKPGEQRAVHYPEKFTFYDFWINSSPCHQASFIKAALLKENGYDEHYRIVADYKKWIEWKIGRQTFRHIDMTICNYMLDGISSCDLELHKKEHDAVIQELYSPEWQEQMRQIDWLKDFYEKAVASREEAIANITSQTRAVFNDDSYLSFLSWLFNHKSIIFFSNLLMKVKNLFHHGKFKQLPPENWIFDPEHPFNAPTEQHHH